MVDSHDLAKVARRPWPLMRAFAWEIALFFVGVLLIGLAAAYLSKFAAAFLSALGAVGITASAAGGWAKSNVQKVADRVRVAVDSNAIVPAIQRLPEPVPKPTGLRRVLSSSSGKATEVPSRHDKEAPSLQSTQY
jgi:hypothetical protein